ncbi:beta-monoglucosyldiacylglycerol synthase [bacterium BMS3Bbin10]|nr:beta-monoglucosyldiacylglycerol synthase [bacterium BMS3Bbin10]
MMVGCRRRRGPIEVRRPASAGETPAEARQTAKTVPPWRISEYEFVKGTLIDAATFERAVRLARRSNVTPRDVLISNGWVRPEDYSRAQARTSAAEFIEQRGGEPHEPAPRQPAPRAPRSRIRRTHAERPMDDAIHGLARRFPGESAGQGLIPAQRYGLALIFAAICISGFLAPIATLLVLAAIATLFFGLVVALRLIACINLIVALPMEWMRRKRPRIADADLPVYTILVPLFEERAVLSQLTQALSRLDYPAARLDIKLIFESVDPDTLAYAETLGLPPNFEFIVVPDRQPRTKPKAVNYALHFARGDFVVIYDAEDQPDPGQLRKALDAFASGPPNLACVQARLTIENAPENWLTKQFAIEYAALFSGILPTLQRLGLPIPLGGTSNHFRASALKWLGAWDAFNVTEDADLGMRLYRHGYICRMLDCETSEEAPCSFKPWLYQRTRWLKGWMQTYFVHMRAPLKLWRQLGTGRFLGFQVMVGGLIFSALVHPLFYALIALKISTGTPFFDPSGVLGLHVWLLALFNVAVGYLASMALCLITLRRGNARLALHILFMPAYWLLISLAAYRALLQLITRPFYWEKTEHGVSRMTPSR